MFHSKLFINSQSNEGDSGDTQTTEKPSFEVIKRPKGNLWIILGTTLMIFVGGGWLFLSHFSRNNSLEAEATPVLVETEVVTKKEIVGTQTLMGTVEPVETVTITSRVMGQITNLSVKEGDRVKQGQVLAQIDVKDIQAQSDRATAAISQSQAGVTVTQAAQIGAITFQNQMIAQLNQAFARKEQSIAQLLEAEAELANAQLQQRRMEILSSEGAVPQVQLDEVNTKVTVIKTRIQQAKASIEEAHRGVESAKAAVEQAASGVEQAKAEVKQAISQVEQARAGKEEASANLVYGIVTAPFDGVVTRKQSEVGAMAGIGQPLVTLEGTAQLRFSVEIPESLISRVRLGETVNVQIDTLKRVVRGSVTQIIPSANPSSRSFTIKISLPSSFDVMPGMFGRMELPESSRKGIIIPANALIHRGQLEGVYVVGANDLAILRWLKTGKVQDEGIEITSGLVEGDRVILSNLSQISDGQPVTIQE